MIECNDSIICMWIKAISEPRHPRVIELGSQTNQSGLREYIHTTGQFAVRPTEYGTICKHRIKEGKLVNRKSNQLRESRASVQYHLSPHKLKSGHHNTKMNGSDDEQQSVYTVLVTGANR